MASSRQERMQERMRGAQRHQVEDVSFGFVLPDEPEAPPPEPPAEPGQQSPTTERITRSTPNTSAKRIRLEGDGRIASAPKTVAQPEEQAGPDPVATAPSQKPPRRSPRSVYSLPSVSEEAGPSNSGKGAKSTGREPARSVRVFGKAARSLPREEPAEQPESSPAAPTAAAALNLLGPPTSRPHGRSPLGPGVVEEVTESPADAPGSGKRRRVRISDATMSSSTLQMALLGNAADLEELPSSSPLTRKSRKSAASTTSGTRRTSARLSGGSASNDDVDELSSPHVSFAPSNPSSLRKSVSFVDQAELPAPSGGSEEAEEPDGADEPAEDEQEDAEEIDDQEAARRLGRKRPRTSLASASTEVEDPEDEYRVPKRRRMHATKSPARQQQPKAKKTQAKAAGRKRKSQDHVEATKADDYIEVTVQRFTKPSRRAEDPDADELLDGEIAFLSRSGVNPVDFLAQMCEEIVAFYSEKLNVSLARAEDTAGRRECKTMLLALEAFRVELQTRLLEHTIALDNLHALRKRHRLAQKEKLGLREEILRIRAERDQVALRMDAARMRHAEDSKLAQRDNAISAAMHDIDMAVEQGHVAAELSAKEQKLADLGNLEFLVSKISDQVCSKSASGGVLKQMKDFNAFLERAVVALENQ